METPRDFFDAVGRDVAAKRIGVGVTAISERLKLGALPSSWFLVMREIASERGLHVSESWFNFKRPSEAASPDTGEAA